MYGIGRIRDDLYYLKLSIDNIVKGHVNPLDLKSTSNDILRDISELESKVQSDIQEYHFRIRKLKKPFYKLRKRLCIIKIFDLEECRRELRRMEQEVRMYEF